MTALPRHVIATAGHVDHGKSSLIRRLTGRDPDRWDEEKRRGLTIDLGFAWTELPTGHEVGFVDVPGHERFVKNMLAGVGPVRLVLFVVAADEGWKPQSEEHLAIVDVLGAEGGVIALTKRDLVDEGALAAREEVVRERLSGTALADAPIVACSAETGEGLEALTGALGEMVAAARPPLTGGRPRLPVDRSFSISGAGTVVTGTLSGGTLRAGDEVEILPAGLLARVRSLQSHERDLEEARPVARVAANLAGIDRGDVVRGDTVVRRGEWRSSSVLEVRLAPVRGARRLTGRGAYKLYAGAAERDVRVRPYGGPLTGPGYARLTLVTPVVVAVGDRFVLREAGRRATVAGGEILDTDPPRRAGPDPATRLARRGAADRADLPALVVAERGAVGASDLQLLTGAAAESLPAARRIGPWWVADQVLARLADEVTGALAAHHEAHPLRPGRDRREVLRDLERARLPAGPVPDGLAADVLAHLASEGTIALEGTTVRLAGHEISLGEREEEAAKLVAAVAAGEPAPPDLAALADAGFSPELVDAACRVGRLTRVGDLVFTPGFVRRAEDLARAQAAEGLTVSGFRQALGTTRKYALPLLERFDAAGITRRDGDVRRLA